VTAVKRILVCGGRDYATDNIQQYKFMHGVLNQLTWLISENYIENDNWYPTDITIIEGGADGADSAASDYAIMNLCKLETYCADWGKYGKQAGYVRNDQMLREGKPDLVLAFPGGKGTAMMIRLARKAGVEVLDMGSKGSQTMTMTYDPRNIEIMLRAAIDRADEAAQRRCVDMLADEYDEIIKLQGENHGVDGTNGTEPD
jgi:hypothetical protein